MKKILLLGSVGCGKTTLMQRLMDRDLQYRKTQFVYNFEHIVDTPGEYLDMGHFKYALQIHAYECDEVAFVHSVNEHKLFLPPGFASYFPKPVFGVITRVDQCEDRTTGLERAHNFLTQAGIHKIFITSAVTGEGIDELLEYLQI